MKNPYEVLRRKEDDLLRVRKEVNALRIIAPLLMDDSERVHLQQRTDDVRLQTQQSDPTLNGAESALPNPMDVLRRVGEDFEISSAHELSDLLSRKLA